MDISLAEEQVFLLQEQLSMDHAEGRAWARRTDAFGRMVKVASLLQKPKEDEIRLAYKEHRYQPFWHITCSARYVYERQRKFTLAVTNPAVHKLTLEGTEYPVSGGQVQLNGVEHCLEEPRRDAFTDGLTNASDPALSEYLKYQSNLVPPDSLDELKPAGAILVPPQSKASALVHQMLVSLVKPVQADRILENSVSIDRVDLYYRPVYAFQYRWEAKGKDAVVEYDAITGKLQTDGKTFQEYVGKILDPEFLLDVGSETLDLFIPGGGLAVKLVKKGYDLARSKKKEGSQE